MKNKDDNIYGTYKKIEHIGSEQSAYAITPTTTNENNKFSLRSALNTLRRNKNNKKVRTKAGISPEIEIKIDSSPFQIINHDQPASTDFVDKQENLYAVIGDNLYKLNSGDTMLMSGSAEQQRPRPRMLTPEEELLFSLINTVNKNPGLNEILNSIRYCPDLYDQIKLVQKFYGGSNIDGAEDIDEDIDYLEITTKVDIRLKEIIKTLTIPEDKKDALKKLALKNSFYLFKHGLWNAFMPMEGDYETIKEAKEEEDYEIMNLGKKEEDKEEKESDYADMSKGGRLGFFATNTTVEKEEAQQEELNVAHRNTLYSSDSV